MATRTVRIWAFRPQVHIVDEITWEEGTTTIDYTTGTFRDIFTSKVNHAGSVSAAFDVLTGWSNGYIGIYPPGDEPWTTTPTGADPAQPT